MPDENRFARLGEAIGETDDARSEPEETDGSSESEPSESTPETEPESDGAEDGGDAAESDAGSDDATADEERSDRPSDGATGGPAFEFEDTTAKSMYVRPETVDVLDDAEFEVESHLRREHDVRDMTGREFHDALVRVAAEHPGQVVEAILAERDDAE